MMSYAATIRSPQERPETAGRGRACTRGFTLVELLVVMGIIVLLMAIGVPSVTALMNSGKLSNTRQAVASAVAAARAVAVDESVPASGDAAFAGAAVVVKPRLNADGDLVAADLVVAAHDDEDGSNNPIYEASSRVTTLSLVTGTMAVGVFRKDTGDGSELNLLTPPFAIRFDAEGVLVTTDPDASGHQAVRYDMDGNDAISGSEVLPSAIGVIVFELDDLADAGYSISEAQTLDGADDTAGAWVRDNGIHLMFNRYSGTVLNEP